MDQLDDLNKGKSNAKGPRGEALRVWPFAYASTFYKAIYQEAGCVENKTYIAVISGTAHPASAIAARHFLKECILLVERAGEHASVSVGYVCMQCYRENALETRCDFQPYPIPALGNNRLNRNITFPMPFQPRIAWATAMLGIVLPEIFSRTSGPCWLEEVPPNSCETRVAAHPH